MQCKTDILALTIKKQEAQLSLRQLTLR